MTLPAKRTFSLSAEKRALLESLRDGSAPAEAALPENDEVIPLSFPQERLWFLDQFQPGAPIYNVHMTVRIPGPLNVTAMRRSISEIVRRHESLRTTFRNTAAGPVQVIAPARPCEVPLVDLREMPLSMREAEVQRLERHEAQHVFDLAAGPLFRATIVRVSDDDHRLLLNTHHIVSDGWSTGILSRELGVLYEAFAGGRASPLPELPIQYRHHARRQREELNGERLERELAYWRKQLEGAPAALQLPTDRPRPAVQSFRGAGKRFLLPVALSAQVTALNHAEGATPFMTLLAVFAALLHRYTGQRDLVLGTPIANRNRGDIEGLIGFFVNTLALRIRPRPEMPFTELLAQVRDVTLAAYSHQDLPFEKLVGELQPERSLSYTPLFQVLFVVQNAPTTPRSAGFAEADAYREGRPMATDTAKFDFSMFLGIKEWGIEGEIEYNTDLFDEATADRIAAHFRRFTEAVVANPQGRLCDLPLLSAGESAEFFRWSSGPRQEIRAASVVDIFDAQCARDAARTAVVFEDERLSYGEMQRRARRLARQLRRIGVGTESRVAVLLERGPALPVAALGVLAAGAAYVPLDAGYPRERLAYIAADARVEALVTQADLLALLPDVTFPVVRIDQEPSEDDSREVGPASADALAYVIYTSGSTGRPKGVAMTHRALVSLIEWQTATAPSLGVTTLQYAPFSFDVSFQEMFSTWAAGGTLVMVPDEIRRDPVSLLKAVERERVGRLFLPPVALQQIAEASEESGVVPSSVREIITAGEQLKISPAISAFVSRLRGCVLRNQYGPTESHVVTQFVLTGDPRMWPARPPIGMPIQNARVYVLDPHLQPVPVGVPGEVHIGGVSVARCYLDRPDLTARKFIADPFSDDPGERVYRTGDAARLLPDGNIEFIGRLDDQLKIRGFRIEPGEVEAVLRGHPSVAETVVAAKEGVDGEKQLVAYVVPQSGCSVTVSELLQFLRDRLPVYMIPAAIVELESLPISPNGKVDRAALPLPAGTRPQLEDRFVAPRNAIEEKLARIWSSVLGVTEIGVHDNFFDLGGHSLLATQVVSRLRDAFNLASFPLRRIFETPVIADLAPAVVQAQIEEHPIAEIETLLAEVEALTDDEVVRELAAG